MDLTIFLKLDASALGGQAASAVSGLKTALSDGATGARDLSEAVAGSGEAAKRAAGDMGDLSEAVGKARGGMGVLNGATAMASGSLQGMAGGAVQAANGMRLLGASMRTAMAATGVLAALAAVAALASKLAEASAAAEELDRTSGMERLQRAAAAAAEAYSGLCSKIERATGLTKDLARAGDAGRNIEKERRLAEIERDRNKELASGADADVVNNRYDAKKREVEFSYRRKDVASNLAGIDLDLASNEKLLAAARQRRAALKEEQEGHLAKAGEWGYKSEQTIWQWTGRADRYKNSEKEERDAADKNKTEIEELDRTIARLEDSVKVLAKRRDYEAGWDSVIDLQEEAARIAATIPVKPKEDPAEKAAPERGRQDSWGSLQTESDRLARIGGFVGGGHMAQNQAREQLQVARRQQQLLEQIERNTSGSGQGGAVLA